MSKHPEDIRRLRQELIEMDQQAVSEEAARDLSALISRAGQVASVEEIRRWSADQFLDAETWARRAIEWLRRPTIGETPMPPPFLGR